MRQRAWPLVLLLLLAATPRAGADEADRWVLEREGERQVVEVGHLPSAVREVLRRRLEADGWRRVPPRPGADGRAAEAAPAEVGEAQEAEPGQPFGADLLARLGDLLLVAAKAGADEAEAARWRPALAAVGEALVDGRLERAAALLRALPLPARPPDRETSPAPAPPAAAPVAATAPFELLGARLRGERDAEGLALVLLDVPEGSAAARAGLEPGDRILAVDGQPAGAAAVARLARAAAEGGQRRVCLARRKGQTETVLLELGPGPAAGSEGRSIDDSRSR